MLCWEALGPKRERGNPCNPNSHIACGTPYEPLGWQYIPAHVAAGAVKSSIHIRERLKTPIGCCCAEPANAPTMLS